MDFQLAVLGGPGLLALLLGLPTFQAFKPLFNLPFILIGMHLILIVLVWIHELGHALGAKLGGLPILGFYAPGFAWCGDAPKGSRTRAVWVGLVGDGLVRLGVEADTPQSRRALAAAFLAGPAANLLAGIAAFAAGFLIGPATLAGRALMIFGCFSILIGGLNLIPIPWGGLLALDGLQARTVLSDQGGHIVLLCRAALAQANGRLPELVPELDQAAHDAQDPISAYQFAIRAAAGQPSEERTNRCRAVLNQLPAGRTRVLLTAQLEFAFWQPGQPLSTPIEIGLPKRPNAMQLMYCAPRLILGARLQGSAELRNEVMTLGRWSRSTAAGFGWSWLLANDRRWQEIDTALGDAFRAGAKIPAGESLASDGQ